MPPKFPVTTVYPRSGLICLNWYDWNPAPFVLAVTTTLVGIDLFGLIRLKLCHRNFQLLRYIPGRDWSVWIDTIETSIPWMSKPNINAVGIDLSGLIRLKRVRVEDVYSRHRRDWSVLIDTIETKLFKSLSLSRIWPSGLICLDWYDWNNRSCL